MIVWSFPHDPNMPRLPHAADPALVKSCFHAHLPAFNLGPDWQCEELKCTRVKYMPGKRCILRYDLSLGNAAGARRQLAFYSKTYGDGAGRFHYELLQKVYEQLDGEVNIPRPLLYWDEAHTLWQEAWEGRPVIEIFLETEDEELFPRLAGTLATFHKCRLPGLTAVYDLNSVWDEIQQNAGMLGWLLPEYETAFQKALAALAAAKEKFSAQTTPAVPVHGALRLEQFIARDQQLALVDFDTVALGDPLGDVAEFLVSLQFLEFTLAVPHARLVQAAQLFRARYAQQAPWPVDRQRLAWYAAAFCLNKMHEMSKHLHDAVPEHCGEMLKTIEGWLHDLA